MEYLNKYHIIEFILFLHIISIVQYNDSISPHNSQSAVEITEI